VQLHAAGLLSGSLVKPARRGVMNIVKCFAATALLGLLFSCASPQSPTLTVDTPENRRQAAEAYLRIVPPEDLVRDAAEKVAESLPEAQRTSFMTAMTEDLDWNRLNAAMVDSMVNRFSLAEIEALAKFYGSAEGKSVMKKFGLYLADVMPVVQEAAGKAFAKASGAAK
jgi:hypothetical protein